MILSHELMSTYLVLVCQKSRLAFCIFQVDGVRQYMRPGSILVWVSDDEACTIYQKTETRAHGSPYPDYCIISCSTFKYRITQVLVFFHKNINAPCPAVAQCSSIQQKVLFCYFLFKNYKWTGKFMWSGQPCSYVILCYFVGMKTK